MTDEPSADTLELVDCIRNRMGGDFFMHDHEAAKAITEFINKRIESILLNPSEEVVEAVGRGICYAVELGRDGECAFAKRCLGAPSEAYKDGARAALRAAGLRILGREG